MRDDGVGVGNAAQADESTTAPFCKHTGAVELLKPGPEPSLQGAEHVVYEPDAIHTGEDDEHSGAVDEQGCCVSNTPSTLQKLIDTACPRGVMHCTERN